MTEAARPAGPPLRVHRGTRFEHARLRQYVPGVRIGDSPPDIARVTRVTRAAVYYRMSDGDGGTYRITPERLHEIVGKMLPDA